MTEKKKKRRTRRQSAAAAANVLVDILEESTHWHCALGDHVEWVSEMACHDMKQKKKKETLNMCHVRH